MNKEIKITGDFKKFVKALWEQACSDEFGNPLRNRFANEKHLQIHSALDTIGFPKGDVRSTFLESL